MKFRLSLLMTGLILTNTVNAATLVNLHNQPAAYLQNKLETQVGQKVKVVTVRTDYDFNHTEHARIQQTYNDIPVWNATGVIHTPKANFSMKKPSHASSNSTSMDGVIYEGLEKDLVKTTNFSFVKAQHQNVMLIAKNSYAKKLSLDTKNFNNEKSKLIVFIDEHKVAHYAYLTSFNYYTATEVHRPTSIIDATTHKIYRTWDAILTEKSPVKALDSTRAKLHQKMAANQNEDDFQDKEMVIGGIGGNEKVGEIIYDGIKIKGAKALVSTLEGEIQPGMRVKITMCALANDDVEIRDVSYGDEIVNDTCVVQLNGDQTDNIAWLSLQKHMTRWNRDEMNASYSPSLDAFYAAHAVKDMYQDWYNVPALIDDKGEPMRFIMRVHYGRGFDNAYWDGEQMTFGDGGSMFYAMSSTGVTAHEISHGFTSTHSGIDPYFPEMGALHESFSDMASIAVENYMTGKNSWELGREIRKDEGALRYLDNPRKDGTSVDHMKDFDASEPHDGAGITNKAFYLLATTKGWDTRKAFDVWVKANMHYWTSSMGTFQEAACGVLAATKDYGYNIADVRVAFAKVGIETDICENK